MNSLRSTKALIAACWLSLIPSQGWTSVVIKTLCVLFAGTSSCAFMRWTVKRLKPKVRNWKALINSIVIFVVPYLKKGASSGTSCSQAEILISRRTAASSPKPRCA